MDICQTLLRRALAHLGEHFQPGQDPRVAWDDAARAALQLPALGDDDEGLLDYKTMTRDVIKVIFNASAEIDEKASRIIEDQRDAEQAELICLGAVMARAPRGGVQVDLSLAQHFNASLQACYESLLFWLTHCPGGLEQATTDLAGAGELPDIW